jgi:site-specific recombinase XerC
MPDRRTRIGLRDHAVLQVLVDAGLRSAELRGLTVGDLIRVRVDSPHRSLRVVRAKGGRGRVVPLTAAADRALDSWLARHPAARPLAVGAACPRLRHRCSAPSAGSAAIPAVVGRLSHWGCGELGAALMVGMS